MEYLRKGQGIHRPVLVDEVLEALKLNELAHLKPRAKFIDATLGLGGHTIKIWERGGHVLGIEADRKSLGIARKEIKKILSDQTLKRKACPVPNQTSLVWGDIKLVKGNFLSLDRIAKRFGFEKVNGVLFDLGISSYQLEKENRGFSFNRPSDPLDMRFDPEGQGVKASDLLRLLDRRNLLKLFGEVMDLKSARKLVRKIIETRKLKSIEKVGDFLQIIKESTIKHRNLNPATLPFLALRIAVNSELENLKKTLPKAFNLLDRGGRLVVISYHSGEDRIVKHFFKTLEEKKEGKVITKKPILPKEEEIKENPRARSARLRVLEKI